MLASQAILKNSKNLFGKKIILKYSNTLSNSLAIVVDVNVINPLPALRQCAPADRAWQWATGGGDGLRGAHV